MQTYYKVFNPITGEHLDISTIEEARTVRKELMNSWIDMRVQEANQIHSVAAVNTDSDGNEIWVAIESELL